MGTWHLGDPLQPPCFQLPQCPEPVELDRKPVALIISSSAVAGRLDHFPSPTDSISPSREAKSRLVLNWADRSKPLYLASLAQLTPAAAACWGGCVSSQPPPLLATVYGLFIHGQGESKDSVLSPLP